jgi:hypothetical protein
MSEENWGDDSNQKKEDEGEKPAGGKSYRDLLLSSLKHKSGKTAANFVEKLANDTQQALGRQSTLKLPGTFRDLSVQESVTNWMDRIFDVFLDFSYDFNAAVAGTNLEVSCDRPVLFNDLVRDRKWSDISETKIWSFKGSISTLVWSLILRGSKDNIQAFIVPKDQIIALSGSQSFFKPYLEMTAIVDRNGVTWKIDEMEMPFERVDEVAQDLFGALIRVSRSEQAPEEKSHLHSTSHKEPPPIPHQSLTGKYKVFAPAVEQSESMKLSFSPEYAPKRGDLLTLTGSYPKASWSAAGGAKAEGKTAAKGLEEEAKPAAAPLPTAESQAETAPGLTPSSEQQDSQLNLDSLEKTEAQAPPAEAKPTQAAAPASDGGQKGSGCGLDSGGDDLMVDGKNIDLGQACDLLVKIIDRDLEGLARTGAEAFTKRDMKAAEDAMKRTSTLNAFREEVSSLVAQWKEQL